MSSRSLPAGFIPPCLPTKAPRPPSGDAWLHEIKHDGFRVIARKDGARVKLYSRPGNDLTERLDRRSPWPIIYRGLSSCTGISVLKSPQIAQCNCSANPVESSSGDMRAAIYLRVSTEEQTTDNQERELRAAAEREIVAVYRDAGISGAKGRDKRPGFDTMHRDAARRRFDVVMAWSVDRLGRSLQDLIAFMMELRSLKIDLFLHKQGLDTATPAGKLMFNVIGSFAEFEREMIQERVKAGIARAKAQGKHCGRPRLNPELAHAIRTALAVPGRPGIRVIAKQFGVSPMTVQNVART